MSTGPRRESRSTVPGGGAFLPSVKPATTLPPPAVRIMMAPAPSIEARAA